ncbi:MAG: hypothetical protein L0H73_15930 [Nitrococcus sp.]|nr:hypothetical protein [Nitrococcus sp.]
MSRHRFKDIHIPGARTRRYLDGLLPQEWRCLEEALKLLREGRWDYNEDPNLPGGGYYFEACGFTIWFTATGLGGVATVTQVRYLPDLPE